MSKAAGLFLEQFPRFMLKRRRRCPNSTILLLSFPIFRSCAQLHDKAGSLHVNPCQRNKNKNKNPAICCPYIQLMMKQDRCYSNSTQYLSSFSTERYIRTMQTCNVTIRVCVLRPLCRPTIANIKFTIGRNGNHHIIS